MKITGLILFIMFYLTAISSAQPPDTLWTGAYGGNDAEQGWAVQQTSGGGYVIAGYTLSFGAGIRDVYLVRVGYPCDYVPGDINGDDNVMGNDVTYGVRYFKGIGPQPPDSCWNDSTSSWLYSAGDVNGSCTFMGNDITFLVGYFKGCNPEILWCPQTP
ncbi:MAG: hypothetical protein DRP26_05535 [Candidatus Zixiibacteriota bacterium]|nr:MAG: hypothetical protein DRP26_05535 [candidate division Zixibacteria bacterium]